jgi:hypothetical protein
MRLSWRKRVTNSKEFRKERYADLMPVIEKAMTLEPGQQFLILCEKKSPHTVAQKLREFFKLAAEQRPDLGIERGDYSCNVLPESKKVVIKRNQGKEYGVVILEDE